MTEPSNDPTAPPIDLTPGRKTSEFSSTRLAQLVSALVLLAGLIHPGFSVPENVQTALVIVLGSAIPLLSGWYAKQRKDVKVGVAAANAQILTAQAAAPPATTQTFTVTPNSATSGSTYSIVFPAAAPDLPELTDAVNDAPDDDPPMLERAANAGAVELPTADPPA